LIVHGPDNTGPKLARRECCGLASSRSIPPPEQYEFFVDECLAMRPVSDMLRQAGHLAHVQGPDTFGTGTKDVDWLPEVGARGWVLITKTRTFENAKSSCARSAQLE
jgi:hypothetical protein